MMNILFSNSSESFVFSFQAFQAPPAFGGKKILASDWEQNDDSFKIQHTLTYSLCD